MAQAWTGARTGGRLRGAPLGRLLPAVSHRRNPQLDSLRVARSSVSGEVAARA